MGANRFLKLGGLEFDSRGSRFFLPPPDHIQASPILRGLDINWEGIKISTPPKIGGAWIITGGLKKFQMF